MIRLVMLCMLLMPVSALAESYLGFQLGGAFPAQTGTVDVQSTSLPAGTTMDPLSLQNSLMVGVKAGYFFADRYDWLGAETELYSATPHIEQQAVTTHLPTGFVFASPPSCVGSTACTIATAGTLARVTTWAPAMLLVRYPQGRLRPYAGIGLGVFFAHSTDASGSSSDTAPGLVAKVGMSYAVTDHVSAFLEWKYNHATLSLTASGVAATADYNANLIGAGLTYHFGR